MGLAHAGQATEIEQVEALLSSSCEREGGFASEGVARADDEILEVEGLFLPTTGLSVQSEVEVGVEGGVAVCTRPCRPCRDWG
jgi:hypothetical protein